MEKYTVNVSVNKVNKKGKLSSDTFEYEFSSGNLVKDRKKAIKKAKKLFVNIEDFLPKGQTFSSHAEAIAKGFKDFNYFMFDIHFINEEGDFSPIFSEDYEERFDWLEYECQVFMDKSLDVDFVEIENPHGELIKVISNELDFLLL